MAKRKQYILNEECDHCGGTGQEVPDCETCDGKGTVLVNGIREDCPDCLNSPCPYCNGKGKL